MKVRGRVGKGKGVDGEKAPCPGWPWTEQPVPIRQPSKKDGNSLGLAGRELYAIQPRAAVERGNATQNKEICEERVRRK